MDALDLPDVLVPHKDIISFMLKFHTGETNLYTISYQKEIPLTSFTYDGHQYEIRAYANLCFLSNYTRKLFNVVNLSFFPDDIQRTFNVLIRGSIPYQYKYQKVPYDISDYIGMYYVYIEGKVYNLLIDSQQYVFCKLYYTKNNTINMDEIIALY